MRRARAVMHAGIANPRWRGKRSRHSRRMHNPQSYVSNKRPIVRSPQFQGCYLGGYGWNRIILTTAKHKNAWFWGFAVFVIGDFLTIAFKLQGPHKWPGARRTIMETWDRVRAPLQARLEVPSKTSPEASFLLSCCLIAAIAVCLWAAKFSDLLITQTTWKGHTPTCYELPRTCI